MVITPMFDISLTLSQNPFAWLCRVLSNDSKRARRVFAKSIEQIYPSKRAAIFEQAKLIWRRSLARAFVWGEFKECLEADASDFSRFIKIFSDHWWIPFSGKFIKEANVILNRVDEAVHPNAFIGAYANLPNAEEYHESLRDWLFLQLENNVLRWSGNYLTKYKLRTGAVKGDISVLVIGYLNKKLLCRILFSLAEMVRVPCITVRIRQPSPRIEQYIRQEVIPSRLLPRNLKVEISSPRDGRVGYDLVICTHYWQHQSTALWDEFARNKDIGTKVLDGGLLVWASAVSRDDSCEYVSEGLPPMDINTKSIVADVASVRISYKPSGVNGGLPRRTISYKEMKKLAGLEHPTSIEFPCSVEYAKTMANGSDVSEMRVCCKYLEWKFANEHNCRLKELKCVASFDYHLSSDGIEGYSILSAKKQGVDDTFFFTVIRGIESKTTELEGNYGRLTFLPALYCGHFATDRFTEGNIRQIFLQGMVADSRIIADGDLSISTDGRIARISSRIDDPVSKRYVVFLSREGDGGEYGLYYSYLPQRRYLTQGSFDAQLQRFNKIEHADLSSLRESLGGVEIREVSPRSVTALHPYVEIEKVLKKRNFEFSESQVYFYKSYSPVSRTLFDGGKTQYTKRVGMTFDQATAILTKPFAPSCMRDEALNRFTVSVRKSLLATLNVHNVLIFAQKV